MSMDSEMILVVDDEQSVCHALSTLINRMGYQTKAVSSAEEALSTLNGIKPGVALVDIRLPGMDGLELLGKLKKASPDTEAIMITGYASTDTAIEAIRKGAYDYLPKPFEDLDEVWSTVKRAFEKRSLSRKNRQLLLDLENSNRGLSAAVKRQKALVDAGRAMGGISDLNELLDFFVGVVADELEVDRVSLMLLDEEAQEMWIVASRGLDESVKQGVRRKVGEGIAGWVAREGKPVLVKDVLSDPRVKSHLQSTHATSFISAPIVLSIPIQLQEKVLGVINVTDRRESQSFDEEDMAFLYSLAGQAAVAIERTRQYDELQAAFESLKATQKTLMETERLNALGQMAAGVAHDFNNLLTGILGRVQLLRMKIDANGTDLPLMHSQLELIENLALQGATTVRRIQEFSRIRKDIPTDAVDLNSVVRTAFEATRGKWKDECESKGIFVEVHLELGKIPETRGNSHEMTQVVTNLIINAVEAMPEGGRLKIRTFLEEETIGLEVCDTGIGMSKEVKEKLFQPFFTTKGNGYGLGTSIVYGIVARHGGEIKVSSEEGEGTTFLLTLPVVEVPPEVLPDDKWEQKARGKESPAKILLVEDNDLNRELFRGYIMEMGHHAVATSGGKDALSILEKGEIDLVVTDLSMPGITGYQIAQEAKKRNPGLPVILVTGWAIQQDENRLRESGVDFLLKKPCRLSDFREMVQKALSSQYGRKEMIVENEAPERDPGRAVFGAPDPVHRDRSPRDHGLRLHKPVVGNPNETEGTALHSSEKIRMSGEIHSLIGTLKERNEELVSQNRLLATQAASDGLTELHNHRAFQEVLTKEVFRSHRYKHSFSLLFMDIDAFKTYNDTHGHLKGDVLLRTIGEILKSSLRKGDTPARYGGDEFVVLLPETGRGGGHVVAEKIRSAIESYPFYGREAQPEGKVTVSIGLASFPADGGDAASLLWEADKALYESKSRGRNTVSPAS